MSNAVYAYDLSAVSLSIAGILIEAGGGDGAFVSVDLPQGFDAKTGVHGDVVSYRLAAEVAEVKITLMDPAPGNEDLFALWNSDKNASNGAGIGDFLLEDLNSEIEISGQCRITKPPVITKQAEAQNFEWSLHLMVPVVEYRAREVVVP